MNTRRRPFPFFFLYCSLCACAAFAAYGYVYSQDTALRLTQAQKKHSVAGAPSENLDLLPPVAHAQAQTPRSSAAKHGRILMYHYVREDVDKAKDPVGYELSVTSAQLETQLKAFKADGFQPATVSQIAAGQGTASSLALTFDDGYEDFYTEAYPLLQKYGWTATVYIISGKIGGSYMTWDQIRDLANHGYEVGAHTVDHINLSTATESQQRHQIFDSKSTIEKEIGRPIYAFCYPSGRYDATSVSLVKEAGFTSATTTFEGVVPPLANPFLLPRLRVAPTTSLAELTR